MTDLAKINLLLYNAYIDANNAYLTSQADTEVKYQLLGTANALETVFYAVEACNMNDQKTYNQIIDDMITNEAEARKKAAMCWSKGMCEIIHKAESETYQWVIELLKDFKEENLDG